MVGTCLLDEEEKTKPIIKEVNIQNSKEYFIDTSIIILNRNWEVGKLDSTLNQLNQDIPVFRSDADQLIFITERNDTINYFKSQINSPNPLIIFTPESGPILCTADQFPQLYKFYFSKLKLPNDTVTESQIKIIKEDSIFTKIHPERELLPFLPYKDLTQLIIEDSIINLPIIRDTILGNRSLAYPILNQNKHLSIRFDNDFWDNTDYYYTNGAAIKYSNKIFSSSPISKILVSNNNSGIDEYGIHIIQHMYTGEKPKIETIVQGDRPWSSYTLFGQYLSSFDIVNKIQHYSEFNIGAIGPESGGALLQNIVHQLVPNNSPPKGWHHQISTDFIIDYKYAIKKLIFNRNRFESYMNGSIEAGFLRDNISWGYGFRYGKFIPFYLGSCSDIAQITNKYSSQKFRYNIIFNIETKAIAYDATLQGGVFNRKSIYVLPNGDLKRFTVESYFGIEASYGKIDLQILQYWKSKEFIHGNDHKYLSIRLNYAF